MRNQEWKDEFWLASFNLEEKKSSIHSIEQVKAE